MINIINELAKKIKSPTKVIMGERIYEEFARQFSPVTHPTTLDDFEIQSIVTDNGNLTVEIVAEDTIQVI